jgi:hypothetical protein
VPDCLKLSVWSGPRNVSTALMYAFRERPDTLVIDEPLYGHYLEVTEAEHPGEEEVLYAMDRDGDRVVREVLLGPCERPVHFFKNMAHHLTDLDRKFLAGITNVLLTRDPNEMLPSLARVLRHPTIRDTGFDRQMEILDHVLDHGEEPIVLDARQLLLDPRAVLRKTCDALDIPFYEAMLRWPAGPKPEDGIWAKHWYANVHASTGFAAYEPKTEPVPESLRPLLDECLPLYERLSRYAIRADTRG